MIPKEFASRFLAAGVRPGNTSQVVLKLRPAFPDASRSFCKLHPNDIDGGVLPASDAGASRVFALPQASHTVQVRRRGEESQLAVRALRKPGMHSPKAPWEIDAQTFSAPGGAVDPAKVRDAVRRSFEVAREQQATGSTRLVHWAEAAAFREHAYRHEPESAGGLRSIVDVGAGTGLGAFIWARNQVKVTATDVNLLQVGAIEAQVREAERAGDVLPLKVQVAQGLEGVTADNCMHVRAARLPCYLSQAQMDELLRAAHQLLGAGGTVYLSTYGKHQWWNQHTPDSSVLQLSSLPDLREQVLAQGFTLERLCGEVNGFNPGVHASRRLDASDEPINTGAIDSLDRQLQDDVEQAERDPRLLGAQVVVHVLLRK